jgi:thiol-disulfide isomerase/thioredoxin
MKTIQISNYLFLIISMLFLAVFDAEAQSPVKTVLQMHTEVNNYVSDKAKELTSQGKRVDREKREDLEGEKKSLANKYAEEAATRSDLKELDLYYLGDLFIIAENVNKALETMKKFLAQYPPETKGNVIQQARSYIVVLSVRKKLPAEAEQVYQAWLKGEPLNKTQQPMLEQTLAVGFFKEKQYEQAIKYARQAFELLKTLEAKTFREKRDKEQLYMNVVEVLALSYRKNDNKEAALEILAEARAQSFMLPSADLYRKVMDFVGGGGFSEKKLMQKVESYATAEPAPELKIIEWIGQEPTALKNLRGKVVLLDFWATWCMPCIATFPRLRAWQKKYGGSDFLIIGVTKYYGRDGNKTMTPLQELEFLGEFKQKHKLPYPFAVAEPGEDGMKYGINAYPTTVLLDRNGVVRYIGIGAGMEESANLEDMIKKLLKDDSQLAASPR